MSSLERVFGHMLAARLCHKISEACTLSPAAVAVLAEGLNLAMLLEKTKLKLTELTGGSAGNSLELGFSRLRVLLQNRIHSSA